MNDASYIGAETRILLSFAMANHGAAFAYWLRDRLMKAFNYYSHNAVYMDCIASRGLETVHEKTAKEDQKSGVTYVQLDTREHFKAQGYAPIGAQNSLWNEMYQKAMSEARAMIMVVTPEYLSSEWCMKEWSQFHEENARRRTSKRAPLKGIAIRFPPESDGRTGPSAKPLNLDGITSLVVPKVMGLGGLLWHKADYGISETSFKRLVFEIGQNH